MENFFSKRDVRNEALFHIREAIDEFPTVAKRSGAQGTEEEVQGVIRNTRMPLYRITPEGYDGYATFHQETIFIDAIGVDAAGSIYVRHRVRKGLFGSKDIWLEAGIRPEQAAKEILGCIEKDAELKSRMEEKPDEAVSAYFMRFLE